MDLKQIMDCEMVAKTLKRITHEIIERNDDLSNLFLVGILNKGLPIADKIKELLYEFTKVDVPVIGLEIANHRDDIKSEILINQGFNVSNKDVILVDDVLFTGRSIRAAMDALIDYGRPNKIQLAVLIDRGHRELPIKPDYIGKNIPTSREQKVKFDKINFTVSIE